MYPLDTIKIMPQTSVEALSIIQTVRKIISTSGLRGFYPGVLPYMTADGLRYE